MIYEDIAEFTQATPTGALVGLDLGTKTIGVAVHRHVPLDRHTA